MVENNIFIMLMRGISKIRKRRDPSVPFCKVFCILKRLMLKIPHDSLPPRDDKVGKF